MPCRNARAILEGMQKGPPDERVLQTIEQTPKRFNVEAQRREVIRPLEDLVRLFLYSFLLELLQ